MPTSLWDSMGSGSPACSGYPTIAPLRFSQHNFIGSRNVIPNGPHPNPISQWHAGGQSNFTELSVQNSFATATKSGQAIPLEEPDLKMHRSGDCMPGIMIASRIGKVDK